MAKINQIKEVALAELKPYENNAKKHGAKQVEQIAKSITEFGFINPILIDKDNNIIAGHGRLLAAKKLGLETVPCINVEGLTEAQYKAYVLADNKLTELGEWDLDLVSEEIEFLKDMDFDISLTGFDFEITEDEQPPKERKDLSDDIAGTYEVIVECENEMQQEEVFNYLTEEGMKCRVLTL